MPKAFFIILAATLSSLLASSWIFTKVLYIAKSKRLTDNPSNRKFQIVPVPVLGGLAVFFGLTVGVMVGLAATTTLGSHMILDSMPVMLAMMLMLYVGSLDDILDIKANMRLFLETLIIIAMIYSSGYCIDSFHGLWGVGDFSWWIAVPLTVFASVGIINAMNMIDGVNGLSSGICIACNAIFGVAFYHSNDLVNSMLAFSMSAALLPFLMHNIFGKHSKMYIGDSGTMVMGTLLSWFTICLLRSGNPLNGIALFPYYNMIAFCVSVLSVPVADTLRVMGMRIINGKNPFKPDRTHLHHALINVGVSHSITALIEIVIDCIIVAIFGWIAVVNKYPLDLQLYIVVASAMILVWGSYAFLNYHVSHKTAFLAKMQRWSRHTHLGHKRWWLRLQGMLDASELKFIESLRNCKKM